MVETKEFAILFKKIIINEEIEEFIPIKVIEGNYNYEDKWFTDEDDIPYLHIEITPSRTVGYACRTKIELMKNSLSEESVEKIKNEIYEYSKKFTYQRDKTRNEPIIATDKETGSEYLFEDLDNFEEYNDYSKESDYETNDIRDMTPLEIEEQIKKTIKGQDQAIKKLLWHYGQQLILEN